MPLACGGVEVLKFLVSGIGSAKTGVSRLSPDHRRDGPFLFLRAVVRRRGVRWRVARPAPFARCSQLVQFVSSRSGRAATRSLRIIMCETVGLDDYGAQLSDAAAARVIEVHKRNTGPGHRILQERDRPRPRQAVVAAQMQESAEKTAAAASVIIAPARPMASSAKCSSIRSSSCTARAIWVSGI